LEPTRYHKISYDAAAVEGLFVDLFLDAHSTAPPQITCVSMNPGTSQAPRGKRWLGIAAGSSFRFVRARMREASITTAQSWRSLVPSKTWSAAIANSISS
jgi:hypothetical protein